MVRSVAGGRCVLLMVVLAVVAGCQPPVTPSPSVVPSPPPSPIAETLEITLPVIGPLGGAGYPIPTAMLHATLFRLDAKFDPVPQLADGPCVPSDDELVLTCGIRDGYFHDGAAITADDVAFSLGFAVPPCPGGLWCGYEIVSVSVVDDRHVALRLNQRSAALVANVLAHVPIMPRREVQASFDRFSATATSADPAEAEAEASTIDDQLTGARPDCDALVATAEATLRAAGATPQLRSDFATTDGTTDTCGYAAALAGDLGVLAEAVRANGVDALHLAFPLLDFQLRPVGAGPWRLERLEPEGRLDLVAFDRYVDGPPAIERVTVTARPDMAAAVDGMLAGGADVLDLGGLGADDLGEAFTALKASSAVRLLSFPDLGFLALMYNLRPGRLFADGRLRQAVERCVDTAAAVDAATGGEGIPVDSWISPASFAYLPPEVRPARDIDGAKQLIETAGWTLASDGIYAQPDGRRLSAVVPVRSDTPDRLKFVDLLAFQLRDCGIELTAKPITFDLLSPMTTAFPHLVPGTDQPFDVYLGGWVVSTDPGGAEFFESRNITSADPPDDPDYRGLNFIGYSNPRVDELIATGRTMLEPKQRARIYRELQQVVKRDRPYLFAWSPLQHAVISSQVTTVDGPIDGTSPLWWWAPERWTFAPPS